jgi:hypothetical protein
MILHVARKSVSSAKAGNILITRWNGYGVAKMYGHPTATNQFRRTQKRGIVATFLHLIGFGR